MAGFDFRVSCVNSESVLIRGLLAGCGRLAARRGLDWHYRRYGDGFLVTVDGPLPYMQGLVSTLRLYTLAFAEGAAVPPRMSSRRSTGRRISRAYAAGVDQATENIFRITRDYGGSNYSLVLPLTSDQDVDDRLETLSDNLMDFVAGFLRPALAIEELHTSAEWLLRRVMTSRQLPCPSPN